MNDPTSTSPGSIMPRYSWLLRRELQTDVLPARIAALRKVGVPYPDGFEEKEAFTLLAAQATGIAKSLQKNGAPDAAADREIIAVIAYLQRLGTDIKAQPSEERASP
jgi:cytochrome c oxidase cbb3-type subunit I/II